MNRLFRYLTIAALGGVWIGAIAREIHYRRMVRRIRMMYHNA